MSREGLEGQRAVDRVPVDSLADFAPSPSLAKALSGGIVRVGPTCEGCGSQDVICVRNRNEIIPGRQSGEGISTTGACGL